MRCPRCLKPVDDEGNCVDPHCGYRVKRNSLRPFWTIFAGVGLVHLALVGRFGFPPVEQPIPRGFWLFVAICWLFVNSAASILLYVAYVYAFELEPAEFHAWLRRLKKALRPIT